MLRNPRDRGPEGGLNKKDRVQQMTSRKGDQPVAVINAIDPIFTRIVLLIREGNGVLVPIAHVYPMYYLLLLCISAMPLAMSPFWRCLSYAYGVDSYLLDLVSDSTPHPVATATPQN